MFRPRVEYSIKKLARDLDGQVIVVDLEVEESIVTIANIYALNDDNPEFYLNAFSMINKFEQPHIIVGGDFNLCFNVDLDKKGTT